MQDQKLRKGPWFEEEDQRLTAIVRLLGERRWDALANASGSILHQPKFFNSMWHRMIRLTKLGNSLTKFSPARSWEEREELSIEVDELSSSKFEAWSNK